MMIMPRVARIKSENGIYHIMVRSISDIPLFKDNEDKNKYLELIKKYKLTYIFKVYAYCLMTTHAHIAIDCCGADISKIVKSINQCYASYFNKKYNRHGHVFQDRFKSKLVDNDKYLLTLTAYIHNNPKDISDEKKSILDYRYSSLGIYLNLATDTFDILDVDYILSYFSVNKKRARKVYFEFVNRLSNIAEKIDIEFKDEGSESRNHRKILLRNVNPIKVIDFISKYTKTDFNIHIKFTHKNTDLKALSILVMRSLCNYSLKEIGSFIGNMTAANLWRLSNKGYLLLTSDLSYLTLIDDIISHFSLN
jgi:REP element-mobilizing transposase RayT